ncbi:MAG: FAD-binding oxidoreductase [Alphaproteobacteria bacterium]
MKVAVIGGGIVGCATAYYLRRRGVSVTILERGEAGAEQSSRALGYVRCQGRHKAELPLAIEASRMWGDLSGELQADLEFVREGNLAVAETEADEARLRRSAEAARAAGLSTRLVDRAEITRLVPKLAGPWRSGIFTAEDGHASPVKATTAFAEAAMRIGAELRTGVAAARIVLADGKVAGVETGAGLVPADAVLCAAGVSTNFLLRPLGLVLPIQTIRSSNVETVPVLPFTRTGVWTPYISIRPRLDGMFSFGTGYRGSPPDHDLGITTLSNLALFLPRYFANPRRPKLRLNRDFFDNARRAVSRTAAIRPMPEPIVNETQIAERLRWASQFFPHVGGFKPARAWAGRIDVTPDLIPIIGSFGRPAGLYVAAGFSAHGLALSPFVGKAMAELIATGRAPIDLRAFRPSRFAEGDIQYDPLAL